ncbi:MAG: Flp pilus assembly complex ATPase component TadA [Planctomycetes bacterium]|nr:Flp pilus assembly complex ATPase component TadA [Planctomycetota bacterium]
MPSKTFDLQARLDRERQLRELTTRIHTLPLDDLLIKIKDDVQRLLECERVTIYVLDARRDELCSRVKDGAEIKEIRVPVSVASCAGYVALKRKGLNIRDAYDARETAGVDSLLKFDVTWDKKTGFRTRQILAVPITKDKNLYGVLQAINTKNGQPFGDQHQQTIMDLADTLAVAFQNHERLSIRSSPLDYLLRAGFVTPEQIDKAAALAQQGGRSVEYILATNFKVPKEEIARSLSEYYRCPFVPFSPELPPPKPLLEKFSMDYLKHHLFVPLRQEDGRVAVAMANPRALTLCDDISRRLGGLHLVTQVSTREDIIELIDHFFGQREAATPGTQRRLQDIVQEIQEQRAADHVSAAQEDKPEAREDDEGMVLLVNRLIEESADKGASDIHIEPTPGSEVLVRLRIDGLCHIHTRLPREFARNIVARIKIMAGLDIAERRLPQDGKIRFKNFGSRDIELRVATIPTAGGSEDAVLRVLAASKPRPVEQLGMSPENLTRFKKAVEEPYGIILCVGPTGSGKTTTLHSALGFLNKPDIKIWTAEDPVEISQPGLRQVQVQSKIGFTFERALRSFLRLDPDVIMIGEMRDLETAGAAVEASLTGHLVFSTLHTNNAPETITRMLDLGLDPFTFGDSLIAILAQRLLRALCSSCRRPCSPTEEQWDLLRREFGDDGLFDALKVRNPEALMATAAGCDRCSGTGYRGRLGIHELLVVDEELRHLVYKKTLSSGIRELAVKKGLITLKQDGIRKILEGKTDLNEVRSVCMK